MGFTWRIEDCAKQQAPEVSQAAHIFDHDARLRSLEITAEQAIARPIGV